jgi:hypothetical protein
MLVANWTATRPGPQPQAPAGPSQAANTHLQPPTRHQEPPLHSSPPPSNTTIVIKKDWAKEKSKRQADAAAARAKQARAPKAAPSKRPSPPRISAEEKGKAKAREAEWEEESRMPKSFRELDEQDSAMEVDVPQSPKQSKPKAAPVRKTKAAVGKRRAIALGERHPVPCGNCERAATTCMKEIGGGACVRCITQKHKCDYSRARGGGKKNSKGKQRAEASANKQSQ